MIIKGFERFLIVVLWRWGVSVGKGMGGITSATIRVSVNVLMY